MRFNMNSCTKIKVKRRPSAMGTMADTRITENIYYWNFRIKVLRYVPVSMWALYRPFRTEKGSEKNLCEWEILL